MGKCDRCGRQCRDYGMVVLSNEKGQKSETVCRECYNAMISQEYGVEDYKDYIPEVTCLDCDGKSHHFYISKLIFPGVSIEWQAIELFDNDGVGYQFELNQEFDDNSRLAVGALYEKIKKGLAQKYVKKEVSHGQTFLSLRNNIAEGRIGWDSERGGRIPKFVIDGKEYTFEQVGEMLLTCEGWNFRLEIKEPTE